MARIPGADQARVYAAAQRFVERALRRNGSVFSSRRRWAPDVLDDLHVRLAEPATGASFGERWAALLAGAGDHTVELAAEACYVHLLFAADLSPTTKRHLVETTLARSSSPPRVSAPLDAALAAGLAGTGVAFKRRRLSQLQLLVDAVRLWKTLKRPLREELLADGDGFRRWLAEVPCDGAAAQREALLHLVHPDAFEPIVSPRVKRRIVAAYTPEGAEDGGDGADVDVTLRGLRAALEPEHGPGFAFVDLVDVR